MTERYEQLLEKFREFRHHYERFQHHGFAHTRRKAYVSLSAVAGIAEQLKRDLEKEKNKAAKTKDFKELDNLLNIKEDEK